MHFSVWWQPLVLYRCDWLLIICHHCIWYTNWMLTSEDITAVCLISDYISSLYKVVGSQWTMQLIVCLGTGCVLHVHVEYRCWRCPYCHVVFSSALWGGRDTLWCRRAGCYTAAAKLCHLFRTSISQHCHYDRLAMIILTAVMYSATGRSWLCLLFYCDNGSYWCWSTCMEKTFSLIVCLTCHFSPDYCC